MPGPAAQRLAATAAEAGAAETRGDENAANVAAIRRLLARWGATRPHGSPLPDEAIGPGRTLNLATPHGELPPPPTQVVARRAARRAQGISDRDH